MARITVRTEVAGTVWKIEAKAGQRVAEGDTLVVIEAMKMEIPVLASPGGTVAEILVREQQPVQEGQAVAVLDG